MAELAKHSLSAFALRLRPIAVYSFLVRYFRGGCSLALSYWAVNVACGYAYEYGAASGLEWIAGRGNADPVSTILAATIGVLAFGPIAFWLRAGVWRAANRHAAERRNLGRTIFWARLAQAMVVLPALCDAAIVYIAFVTVTAFYPIVFLNDPDIEQYVLKVLPDGKTLSVSGGVRFGLAREMEALLDASPNIKTIYLNSPGGRIGAADQVAQLIHRRGLDTYVSDECLSICTRIFVAGKNRTVLNTAKLGFHDVSMASVPSIFLRKAEETVASSYTDAGIDPGFTQHALSVPPQGMWYPSIEELLVAHVITKVTNGPGSSVKEFETTRP